MRVLIDNIATMNTRIALPWLEKELAYTYAFPQEILEEIRPIDYDNYGWIGQQLISRQLEARRRIIDEISHCVASSLYNAIEKGDKV